MSPYEEVLKELEQIKYMAIHMPDSWAFRERTIKLCNKYLDHHQSVAEEHKVGPSKVKNT